MVTTMKYPVASTGEHYNIIFFYYIPVDETLLDATIKINFNYPHYFFLLLNITSKG